MSLAPGTRLGPSREIQDIAGIPGPSELRLSADGRTLALNRTVLEGDVWLLTLK